MKFRQDSKMMTAAVYAFLVLAAAILFNLLLSRAGTFVEWVGTMIGYIMPAVYGFVFAYLLNPLMRLFDDKLLRRLFKKMKPGLRRGIAIFLTYILAVLFIGLFFSIVLPQLISSLVGIGANVPVYLKYMQTMYFQLVRNVSDMQMLEDSQSSQIITTIIRYVMAAFEGALEELGNWLTGDMVNRVFKIASNLTSGILEVTLGIIISIYLLADREKLFAQLRKISNALFKDHVTGLFYEILMDTNKMFSGFITGKIIDSLLVGILCFAGMSILGLPFAVLISVIVSVSNIIPYFGPIIGAIPGILLIFISDPSKGPMQALIFLVFILVLQQFDGNVLEPKILGSNTGLSALWVVVSIMLFSGMFGVIGMFIGVPLFGVLYNLVRKLITNALEKKGKSTSTGLYASEKNPLIK